jgi:2-amino-4-hydroxy-6-hydroxymethyldihydropteridine diphosphokinase
MMTRAWVGIGSNEGDRLGFVKRGLGLLVEDPDIELAALSSLYDSEPFGVEEQPRFLNLVAGFDTSLTPEEFLGRLFAAEDRCGRTRRERWGPRTLDLDLLTFGDLSTTSAEMTVPHPGIPERAFVLIPFAEVAPDLKVPGTGSTVSELLAALGDTSCLLKRIGDAPTPGSES